MIVNKGNKMNPAMSSKSRPMFVTLAKSATAVG